jgi:8-oxo-dGTP pyrophosphatase MutT (NUDIX family)
MIREAKEESGLDVRIVRPGPLLEYVDEYGRAIAVPFLIESDSAKVSLTEHSEYKWIAPTSATRYRAVPDLLRALEAFGLLNSNGKRKVDRRRAAGDTG